MKQIISQELLQTAERLRDRIIGMRPFPEETLRSLREYYRIGLTYTSNALEGNSLTESETKIVVEDGLTIEGKPLRDTYEAVGHAQAYDFIQTLTIGQPLREQDILELHRLFYEKIDSGKAGHYRQVPVFISGSHYAVTAPAKIPEEMRKFVDWFNKNEGKLPTPEFAALAHQKFVFIHPFIDGNGRVARLILNLALLRGEYTIALIPAILRHEYVAALEQSHTQPAIFIDFIAERIINTQMDLIRLLAGNGEKEPDEKTNLADQIYSMIADYPGIKGAELSEKTGKGLRTVQRYLKTLSDAGRIEYRGSRKTGGFYPL